MEHNGRCVMLMRGGQILGCVLIMEPVGLRAELNVACGDYTPFSLSSWKLELPLTGESMRKPLILGQPCT